VGDDGLWIGPAGGVGWIVTSWRALQAKCSHLDHRPSAGLLIPAVTRLPRKPGRARCRSATRYGVVVDIERAADLYVQGWTLRQIGAELDVHWSTVGQQEGWGCYASRRSSAHPASTDQICGAT
jgi:hypothetical protein